MRGLAFPTDPAYHREYSNERATPFTNVGDIPIDPALAGPVIDPAILAQEDVWNNANSNGPQHRPIQPPSQQPSTSQYHTQYSPGPQGDPFAPQPLPMYFPDSSNMPTPKPIKRKRKPRREEECGFCQGDDSKNKDGQREVMVTCSECGRSGHPTCMDLGEVADVVRSYQWNCIECKNCEICHEKGDDERILFCDFCDRGWHMDCLQPALNESPPGKWHCPLCPPPEFQFLPSNALEQASGHGHFRESSVASTSYSREVPIPASGKRKGKSKVMFTDDSEVESPVSQRGNRNRKTKGKGQARVSDTDQEEASVPGTRPIKRMRLKVTTPPPPRMVVRLRLPPNRHKGKEREEEEEPQRVMFEDVLTAEDRDITRTTIETGDKLRYERSRTAAEVKLFPPTPAPLPPPEPDLPIAGPSSRPLRSSHLHSHPIQIPSTPGPSGSPAPSTPGPGAAFQSSSISALRIRTIRFGEFDIQTWYDAPFPEEYANLPDGRLWLCEFCLKYMRSQFLSLRHRTKCKMRHPPGDEIYRDGAVSIFEVDGRKNKIYCQNLCLLSKMFLDHKSLFYDVEPFLFYVITEADDIGAQFVGYFSKEKRSPKDYNVSCIMTLPVRQRKGWGNLLIDFSYLLSKKEQRVGSPEKPLSALGALGYKNYWTLALMRYLDTAPDNIRLEDISASTCMTIEDTCATLTQQGMLIKRDTTPTTPLVRPSPGQSIKFTRGRKNGIARRHLQRKQTNDEDRSNSPFTVPTDYEIKWDREVVRTYLDKWEAKGYLKLKPERLKWSPFILFRTRKTETFVLSGTDANGGPHVLEGSSVDGLSTFTPNPEVNTDTPSTKSVHENSACMPLESTASIPSNCPDARTTELLQMERDRALAFRLANAKPAPITRLRSQDNTFNDGSGTYQSNGKSHSPRSQRSRSQSSKAPTPVEPAPSFEDDEALAAKLASEESRSRRQLRSRSSTSGAQELKRTLSSRAQTPARKRRRIDSSPELESPIIKLLELDAESVNANGDGVVHNGISIWQSSEAIHGGAVPEQTKEDSVNGLNGQISLTLLNPLLHPSEPEKLVLEIPVLNQLEAPKNEVQELEIGTPLTALTSRISELGVENDTPVEVEEAVKGEERDHDTVIDADGMVDEDAEGEVDEDAEGEPDEEVDYT